MKIQFEILRNTRKNFLKLYTGLSEEQMFKKVPNFNNTTYWNFSHILITQQILCLKLAGKTPSIKEKTIEMFKKGSSGGEVFGFNPEEVALTSVDELQEAYINGELSSYQDYETSYGVTLKSIEDAICFNNTHEALHLGYAMSMKKYL
jgi:hypothetical protein